MNKSNIDTSSKLVKNLIEVNPELKEQFKNYSGAGLIVLTLCLSVEAGEIGVKTSMIIGAALYREWLLSRGIDLKEVEGKHCNG